MIVSLRNSDSSNSLLADCSVKIAWKYSLPLNTQTKPCKGDQDDSNEVTDLKIGINFYSQTMHIKSSPLRFIYEHCAKKKASYHKKLIDISSTATTPSKKPP